MSTQSNITKVIVPPARLIPAEVGAGILEINQEGGAGGQAEAKILVSVSYIPHLIRSLDAVHKLAMPGGVV